MRRILRRSIVTALGMVAVGIVGVHSAQADGIPPPPPQVQPQVPPTPPPAYHPAPPVVQQYVYPPPAVVYTYPPPPVVTYVPAPSQVVVVPRPYYWGAYRRVGGPFIAHGYGRPWGGGFRHW